MTWLPLESGGKCHVVTTVAVPVDVDLMMMMMIRHTCRSVAVFSLTLSFSFDRHIIYNKAYNYGERKRIQPRRPRHTQQRQPQVKFSPILKHQPSILVQKSSNFQESAVKTRIHLRRAVTYGLRRQAKTNALTMVMRMMPTPHQLSNYHYYNRMGK